MKNAVRNHVLNAKQGLNPLNFKELY